MIVRNGNKQSAPNAVQEEELPETAEVTEEIAKSLLELKDSYDLPTEEVERAINSRTFGRNTACAD